ncbi:histone-lysine N-methyltransferase SETMAR-like [Hydra vulgaris]|uniref:histone-lysine N-methyltransferase SETMAR-like n=1 Tax=Hydra vulgaris TaxID=6087 RepID=UPI00064177F8|nr:histone-lysine N-methyltransferase SETMAR-like [Hydra vulgaris]
MEKTEIRAVIKYQYLKGLKPQEIINDFNKTLGSSAPLKTIVYNWYNEFNRGRSSKSDAERSGRPEEVTTEEMIEKIHDNVIENRKIKVCEIANRVNIFYERVFNILHKHLEMKKLAARWMPRVLTVDQKRNRVRTSQQCLDMFNCNQSEFLRRFITMDETWIHYYTPESRQQSAQWLKPEESRPKQLITQQSAGKVMASATLINSIRDEIQKSRPHMRKKKILYHHDNAPSHTSLKAMAKLDELGWEILPQPA